ncbi:hypothetical protein PHMEG_0008181 [Phytophthora megakarya]|uniref:Uncharacterized protein n=1 Tax=Phytophthora megakarya TaxID=4795 RepID=A0A225WJN1_9STRA|nr:hypothetical protein PHMEG_0008181 [Phytophthora megakarya]
MVNLKDAVCHKHGSSGEWELSTKGHTYHCNNLSRTFTWLFYLSDHLPCQRLMHIAGRVHRFAYLPELTILQRLDMMEMSEMENVFQAGVKSLQAVQTSMKGASEAFSHDGLTQPKATEKETENSVASSVATEETNDQEGHGTAQTGPKKNDILPRAIPRVIYVKIRHREPEEKYCYAKAVFELVMEYLSSLSSPELCSALPVWKDIVCNCLRQFVGGSEAATVTTTVLDKDESAGDANWSDTASEMAPADLVDTMSFIQEM